MASLLDGDPHPAAILRAIEDRVQSVARVEVEQVELLLDWADLHSGDPQEEPGAVPVRFGGPTLVTLGGEGTPALSDLCLPEIATARRISPQALRHQMADALDLRHRLPLVWAGVQDLVCPAWVARRVARMTRQLSAEQVQLVDTAVAAALAQGPSRILEITEAKIIEADPEAHQARLDKTARTRDVWLIRPRAGEDRLENPGLATIVAKLSTGDATAFHAAVTELAVLLEDHAAPRTDDEEPLTAGHWRSEALALLADPAAALAFLHRCDHPTPAPAPAPTDDVVAPLGDLEHTDQTDEDGAPEDTADHESPAPEDPASPEDPSGWWPTEPLGPAEPAGWTPSPFQQPARTRGVAKLYLHLALTPEGDLAPVTRVEGLGPVLTGQLADLLRNHDITVTPVVDLHRGRSVNGYEHPTDVRERIHLRTAGSVFPHATDLTHQSGRPPDLDHVIPYESPRTGGPPGQTGDHNTAPLQRLTHRAKTHLGYTVLQTGPASWIWGTPNGLYRLVDHRGTHHLTQTEFISLRDHAIDASEYRPTG